MNNNPPPPRPPSPGSFKAIAKGCTCPVLDNHHGQGYMGMPGVFVYSGKCPVHAARSGFKKENP